MKKHLGKLSLTCFLLFRFRSFLTTQQLLEIDPVLGLLLSYLFLLLGIGSGFIGLKSETRLERRLSRIGLVLNFLGLIFFSAGLFTIFLNQ